MKETKATRSPGLVLVMINYTGLTRAKLANKLGVARVTIWRWEHIQSNISITNEYKIYNLFPTNNKYKSEVGKHLKYFGRG